MRVLKVENSENRFHSCKNSARCWPGPWNASALEDLGSEARFPWGGGSSSGEEDSSQSQVPKEPIWYLFCSNLLKAKKKEEAVVEMGEYSDTCIFFSLF